MSDQAKLDTLSRTLVDMQNRVDSYVSAQKKMMTAAHMSYESKITEDTGSFPAPSIRDPLMSFPLHTDDVHLVVLSEESCSVTLIVMIMYINSY
jgi:hypothetical protein